MFRVKRVCAADLYGGARQSDVGCEVSSAGVEAFTMVIGETVE